MIKKDIFFMRQALELAQVALESNEVPVGAIIIDEGGQVLGKGYNLTETLQCQLEHAELRALREATKNQRDWRLDHGTLYVTLEPCMMCISALALSRIERIVFAAKSPLFGFHLDKEGVLALYTRQIKNITEGVLQHEAAALLKHFFTQKREIRSE